MLLNCDVGEDSWESLGLWGDPTSPSYRRSVLGFHWKDWCWSWNSNTLATWWEELTHLKRPWCWERLKVGGEGDHRGWDGWMASPTQRTWVWVVSGSWWWTGRPGVLRFMGSQRVEQDWATELNWTDTLSILETAMATHSWALAWRIPGMGEPGGLPSIGSHRAGHDWSDLAAAAAYIVSYLIHYQWAMCLLLLYMLKLKSKCQLISITGKTNLKMNFSLIQKQNSKSMF